MSEAMSDNTLRKVRALMAKTIGAGCTEAEAIGASAKVAEVLAAYNMSMTDIEQSSTDNAPTAKREKTMNSRSAFYDFHVDLMAAIAKANFCKHWVDIVPGPAHNKKNVTVNYKRHILLGRQVNVISANLLYDYLIEATATNMPKSIVNAGGGNSRSAHSFRMGCCKRLTERVMGQHETVMAESRRAKAEQSTAARNPANAGGGNALMLIDVFGSEEDLNEDAFWEYTAGTTARRKMERAAKEAADDARSEIAYQAILERRKLQPVVRELVIERTAEEKKQDEKDAARWRKEYDAQCAKADKQRDRDNNREDARRRHAESKIDHDAYAMGKQVAGSISLNRQIDKDEIKVIK